MTARIIEDDYIRWKYNCYDISYTLEVALATIKEMETQPLTLQDFWKFQQVELAPALTQVMNRGIRIDLSKKESLFNRLSVLLEEVEAKLNWLIGETFNPRSPKQTKQLFTELLHVKPIVNPKTKSETFGAAAMLTYLEEYPLLRPLIILILEYRSISVFVGVFLSAEVDYDGRMRSSYNIAGTRTYRLASRKNAFGAGMNLQNVPSKGKIDLNYSLIDVEIEEDAEETEGLQILITSNKCGITDLPNCKQLFIPDDGMIFFDVDYSGADAMVVAWDSQCTWLMEFFKTSKEKLYIYLGQEYLQRSMTVKDPLYKKFKAFCHGTNYGMGVIKAAETAGMSLLEAKKLQKFYFDLCPEIPEWHKRIASEVKDVGYISNVFGARGYFLDKNDPTLLNKAYAWIPQSTIGIMVNKGLVNIHKEAEQLKNSVISPHFYKGKECSGQRPIEVLMQVHDSLAGQYDKRDTTAPDRILEHMKIELSYPKPLTIPAEIGTSELSYGDC